MREPINHKELICYLSFGKHNPKGKPCLWIQRNDSLMNYGEYILLNDEDFGILFERQIQKHFDAGYKIKFVDVSICE